jgi:electron transfer flavoprotein alpha/beta subunit
MGTIIREGMTSILNPFCEYALDKAVELKSQLHDSEVMAISMGPPQARSALLRCLELGADSALLLSDPLFAGSDTWATAKTLERCIRTEAADFDLVLTGKQAIDGDTAQVPVELAELLGIPHINDVSDITLKPGGVIARKETGSGHQMVETELPALLAIGRGSNIRRLPSMKDVLEARGKPLRTLGASELRLTPEGTGLERSLTRVTRVFAPPTRVGGIVVDGSNPEIAAERMIAFLRERGILWRSN